MSDLLHKIIGDLEGKKDWKIKRAFFQESFKNIIDYLTPMTR